MKQYVIDELEPAEIDRLRDYLEKHLGPAALGSIYWLALPPALLSEIQQRHTDCQPFYFALDLDQAHLACELLVRTQNAVRCSCIGYATVEQRAWLMEQVDTMLAKLKINR